MSIDEHLSSCLSLADFIEDHSSDIRGILQSYETFDAASDEIERSISTLRNARTEYSQISDPLSELTMCTFFPLNLPLYSLVLFGVVPAAYTKYLYIRPPEAMFEVLSSIYSYLKISERIPAIILNKTPRNIFTQVYASEAHAIMFTGKFENALKIYENCPQAVLLYNGSGVNPFIIFHDADVDLSVSKAVEMRCFNSGQDCAGPDAFIIHESRTEEFITKLRSKLATVKVGDTMDDTVQIGPTMKQSYISELKEWIGKHQDEIIFGGKIDEEHRLVQPTIALTTAEKHALGEFHEFFAPFFYVISYRNDDELERLITSKSFTERAMYTSVFGTNNKITNKLTSVRVIHDKIVNDVERGNTEYGGYGPEANFVLYEGKKHVRPILIGRDLHKTLR